MRWIDTVIEMGRPIPGDIVEPDRPDRDSKWNRSVNFDRVGFVAAVVLARDVTGKELRRTGNDCLHDLCPLWWVWWDDGSNGFYVDHHIRRVRSKITGR